eukprot:Lithocolla_globosa_v1_NODE_75_length_6869_cov_16.602289.p4 type:complete len:106 gc:universal NODE_75_length_6869_cov_16.602289:5361-5044(-)
MRLKTQPRIKLNIPVRKNIPSKMNVNLFSSSRVSPGGPVKVSTTSPKTKGRIRTANEESSKAIIPIVRSLYWGFTRPSKRVREEEFSVFSFSTIFFQFNQSEPSK